MCCLVTILMLVGPRLAILVWWFMDAVPFDLAFHAPVWPLNVAAVPFWVWPVLGVIFLPWTTLAYLFVAPGGVAGLEWVVVAIGLLIDLSSHSAGGYRHRDRIPGYSGE
jgi:hypothetical protein